MKHPNRTPKTFRSCLEELMERRKLSATQLSHMLGYKSKTALLRVLQGTAGIRSVANIYEDLCICPELNLTSTEREDLREACQVEYWGMEKYRARAEMHRLLLKNDREIPVMTLCTGSGETLTLPDFLNRFTSADHPTTPDRVAAEWIEVMLYGGCYLSVIHPLTHMLDRLGGMARVRHLFHLTADTARTIRIIRNILPVIGHHGYEASVSYNGNALGDNVYQSSGTGHALLLRAGLSGGETREFQILLQNENSGIILESPGIWTAWQQYGAPLWEYAEPIVAPLPCVKDYISFVTYFAVTEKNREILAFKSDFCLNFIPADILYHAITDTAASITASCEEMTKIMETLDRLRSLQEKRFQNICIKKQPTYWVASASAMRQFARTGIQKDHFFAMRPFTAEERLRIFRVLVSLCHENPAMHFHLLKEDEEKTYVELEAVSYTGVGFQLTPIDAHYNLSHGWTETMFTEKDFCGLYHDFYLQEFLPHHTRSTADSLAVLEEIIRILENGDLSLL